MAGYNWRNFFAASLNLCTFLNCSWVRKAICVDFKHLYFPGSELTPKSFKKLSIKIFQCFLKDKNKESLLQIKYVYKVFACINMFLLYPITKLSRLIRHPVLINRWADYKLGDCEFSRSDPVFDTDPDFLKGQTKKGPTVFVLFIRKSSPFI